MLEPTREACTTVAKFVDPAMSQAKVRLPKALKIGDTVRLVSPASYPTEEDLARSVAELESWGLRVEVASHAMSQHGPMAGTDRQRLDDMNDALRDPNVRGLVATRGGVGSFRIAGDLDYAAAATDPKPFVGFSDVTNIQMALWQHARIPSVHGCVDGERAAGAVRQLLMGSDPLVLESVPDSVSSAVSSQRVGSSLKTSPRRASGVLLGGNLREFAGLVGVGLPDLDGAILFIEDKQHAGIGQVDRNLTQLLRSGALDGVAGIVLGLFDEFAGFVDRGWGVVDVLQDRLGGLGVPILGGIKVGHGGFDSFGNWELDALSLGSVAKMDVDAGTLTLGPCVSHDS